MKKLFLNSILILSLLTSVSLAQTKTRVQAKPKVKTKTATKTVQKKQGIEVPFATKVLANGLEVIVLQDSSVPLVTVELAVRNGSFTETPDLNGLSHLYEHMFFKENEAKLIYGCELAENRNDRNYLRGANCDEKLKLKSKIGDVGYLSNRSQLNFSNATTREEVVNYFLTTTSTYLSSAIRSMSDSIRYPNFDEQELNEEKKVVLGEYDRQESSPFYFADTMLKEKLFYRYPSRKKPLGVRSTINAATVEKMRMIQSRYYVPNNTALVVTGDVKPQDVFKLAEEHFGSWEKRKVDPFKEFPLVEHPALKKSEGVFMEQPINSVVILVGWHGPSIGKDDEATYAADVFSYIVTQPDSRFQRALVDSGLAVQASIGYYTQRNVGPIQVVLVTSPENAKPALEALYKEIAEFDKPNYFTNAELESAKTILESRDLFEREKLTDYSHTLSFWWSSTGIEYFRDYYKNLRNVSRLGTARYVKTYIQKKPHISVAMLSAEAKIESKLNESDLIGK